MLLTKKIKVFIVSKQKYYLDKGYILPKKITRNLEIEIDIKDLNNNSNKIIEYSCDNCKKIKTCSYYSYYRKQKQTGDFCNVCNQRINNSGSQNKRYNHSLTDEDRLTNRDTADNIHWRITVFKKDNFKCIICKDKKGNNLQAHHLNSYTTYPLQRFDVNNGVTLCKICHKSFHKSFGYINTNENLFKQYLKEIEAVYFD
jgi:hypothetical protein